MLIRLVICWINGIRVVVDGKLRNSLGIATCLEQHETNRYEKRNKDAKSFIHDNRLLAVETFVDCMPLYSSELTHEKGAGHYQIPRLTGHAT